MPSSKISYLYSTRLCKRRVEAVTEIHCTVLCLTVRQNSLLLKPFVLVYFDSFCPICLHTLGKVKVVVQFFMRRYGFHISISHSKSLQKMLTVGGRHSFYSSSLLTVEDCVQSAAAERRFTSFGKSFGSNLSAGQSDAVLRRSYSHIPIRMVPRMLRHNLKYALLLPCITIVCDCQLTSECIFPPRMITCNQQDQKPRSAECTILIDRLFYHRSNRTYPLYCGYF